jgi:O-acetylhomoserine (thiol)-lyase
MTTSLDPAAGPAAGPTVGFATQQLHAGREAGDPHQARATPIYLTAGFAFDGFDHAQQAFSGNEPDFIYSRHGNPTGESVERRLAALERGSEAMLVASGQAATANALLAILHAGDHLVSSGTIYEGTRGLFLEHLSRFGISIDFVDDPTDLDAWRTAVTPATRAFFAESISNPKNNVLDIAAVAEIAHAAGAPLIIDNTLATPYLVRPIEHGADIVVHSASKFLAGHGSVLGGFIVDAGTFDWGSGAYPHLSATRSVDGLTHVERYGRRAFAGFLRDLAVPRFGAAPSPINAFLIEQGIETLSLRVERQSGSAAQIARFLEAQPEVESVDYAGLESNPNHATASRYLSRGFGSVFAFTLVGGEQTARRFYDSLRLFTKMTHLGDVRSLVIHPSTTTHNLRTEEEQRRAGITPGLIRLSVGIEDLADLIWDLSGAFAAVREAPVEAPVPDVVRVA